MKYMGSKTALLRGKLGDLLLEESRSSERFVDLFAGAGSVSHFIAENTHLPVISSDLQNYSRFLVGSITEREAPVTIGDIFDERITSISHECAWDEEEDYCGLSNSEFGKSTVLRARDISSKDPAENFITRHYGGHYFSPRQARLLDQLYRALPDDPAKRVVGMAVLLRTASTCAAAPGHTAQPFQPSEKLIPYINSAWRRDPLAECKRHLAAVGPRHARVKGSALVGDALTVANDLDEGDLVFCDPPYSSVQYSRFYHVLEGISLGGWGDVSGAGRAPDRAYRQASDFSMVSQSKVAMQRLLTKLRSKSCRVMVTFPNADASNGMSGEDIARLAAERWYVTETHVDSTHSTMGGSSDKGGRGGRRNLEEVVLLLEPKRMIYPVVGPEVSKNKNLATSDHTSLKAVRSIAYSRLQFGPSESRLT